MSRYQPPPPIGKSCPAPDLWTCLWDSWPLARLLAPNDILSRITLSAYWMTQGLWIADLKIGPYQRLLLLELGLRTGLIKVQQCTFFNTFGQLVSLFDWARGRGGGGGTALLKGWGCLLEIKKKKKVLSRSPNRTYNSQVFLVYLLYNDSLKTYNSQ